MASTSTAVANSLPLTESVSPADQAELAAIVRDAYEKQHAIYPIGGGTSLDFGLMPKQPGRALLLERMNRVVDYPARDLTITVEAGMTVAALAETLAAEGQRLPIDVPQPAQATVGGVVATNVSGPGRYGHGTVRDYVIGISAVDGSGRPFKGGGRVVKNVAGYDFCKLLTGSLGTIGVIMQLTFKLKPLAEVRALVACAVPDLIVADKLLAALITSRATPSAIELLAERNRYRVVVGLEGSRAEVAWMQDELVREWRELGVSQSSLLPEQDVANVWQQLTEFQTGAARRLPLPPGEPSSRAQAEGGRGEGTSQLVLKFNIVPSRLCTLIAQLFELLPDCSVQAHAGNGLAMAALASPPPDMQKLLVQQLQPLAARSGGHVVVWANPQGEDFTRQAYWGPAGADVDVMREVKRQFDPRNLLNPGRFVYGT